MVQCSIYVQVLHLSRYSIFFVVSFFVFVFLCTFSQNCLSEEKQRYRCLVKSFSRSIDG